MASKHRYASRTARVLAALLPLVWASDAGSASLRAQNVIIVTLDTTITFALRKSGGWKSTILGGEGLVCELTGPGRVLMQSRSEESFLGWLLPKLPTRSN